MIKFTPIVPGKFDKDAFSRELNKGLDQVATFMLGDFRKTTASWTTPVRFDVKKHYANTKREVTVYTTNDVYGWVNEGTRAHPIYPRRPGGLLRYQIFYRRKTSPRNLLSRSGGKYGPWTVRSSVEHPGIEEPRKFDEVIAQHTEPLLIVLTDGAMARGVQQCGHAL